MAFGSTRGRGLPFSVSTQVDQVINYAKSCVKPAHEYFEERFTEDLAFPLSVFKQARKFDPSKIVDMHLSADDIEDLHIFHSSTQITSFMS